MIFVGSDPYEPTTQAGLPRFGNHIWLCGAVSVLGGGNAEMERAQPVKVRKPSPILCGGCQTFSQDWRGEARSKAQSSNARRA